ncbi:hypothetical protein VNO77_42228 [Canavalia gladiata]|uniref:Uncharacterized protein n=1 Tax=Canavalia gladiata TaxID=3824 RepID=A0AAN9K1Y3_CANGL
MNTKILLVLVMFLASVLLSAEVSPKYQDEKFDKTDDIIDTSEVDGVEYGPLGGHHGGYGSWRSGAPLQRGLRCRRGCCQWIHGRCIRCCFRHGHEHGDAETDVKPYN